MGLQLLSSHVDFVISLQTVLSFAVPCLSAEGGFSGTASSYISDLSTLVSGKAGAAIMNQDLALSPKNIALIHCIS